MAETNRATGFFEKFTVLKDAPRELWIAFIIKFLNYAAYGITSSALKRWLSTEFGYSDQEALAVVALWAVSITAVTLVVGSLTDAIGLRKAFFLGVWVCLFARAMMVFATDKWLALGLGLFPLAIGEALGTPVLVAAIRKYSNARQRSFSFSLSYAMLNVGGLTAGVLFDEVRNWLGEMGHFPGTAITTYRTLFMVSWVIQLLMLPLLWFIREGAEVTDEGTLVIPPQKKAAAGNLWQSFWRATQESVKDTIRVFRSLLKQSGFYRLVVFLLLISFLKLIFMQMSFVFPEFGIRELGPGAPVGKLWGLNSLLIIFLVPLIGVLTQRFPAYHMVTLGGIISAASVFIMALPTDWFQSLADGWFGSMLGGFLNLKGPIHPYYPMITIYVIVLSFGEAFYSPRVYEYAAAIAPKGQEGSYGALSYIPFLLAKLLIGVFSGTLLAKYCPAVGERHSDKMWLAIALFASVAPIGLIALRNYIRVKEAGRQT